jgi:hypothetical protein
MPCQLLNSSDIWNVACQNMPLSIGLYNFQIIQGQTKKPYFKANNFGELFFTIIA